MTPRMWSTSRWPRSASTRSRTASSSRPKRSASAGNRGLLGGAIIAAFRGWGYLACLERELQIGARERHAKPDLLVGLARHHARHAVLDGATHLAAAARVTDSDPAAKHRTLAGALELSEQRSGAGSDDLDAGMKQGHGDGLAGARAASGGGDKALLMDAMKRAGVACCPGDDPDQAQWPAYE